MLLIREDGKETNGLSDFHWGTIQPAIDCGSRTPAASEYIFTLESKTERKRDIERERDG